MKRMLFSLVFVFLALPLFAEMIDGPAVVFDGIRGKQAALLNDGVRISVIERNGAWVKFTVNIHEKDLNKFSSGNISRKITKNHEFSIPVFGKAGTLKSGITLTFHKTHYPHIYKLVLYTVQTNLKDKVVYYKSFTHRFTGTNTVSFQFTELVPMNKANIILNEYGIDGRDPNLNRFMENEEAERYQHLLKNFHDNGIIPKYGIVEVGYYRGRPTVVHRIFVTGPPNNEPKITMDRFYVNEKGYLKSYFLDGPIIQQGVYTYSASGAYVFFRSEVDIYAPAAAKWEIILITEAGNLKYMALFHSDLSDFDKRVKTLTLKTFQNKREIFTQTLSTRNAQDAINQFRLNPFFQKMNLQSAGINFSLTEIAIRNLERR